ncbi:MAG: hypothetical protein AB8F65_11655 [Woeseiaceae bacterium]
MEIAGFNIARWIRAARSIPALVTGSATTTATQRPQSALPNDALQATHWLKTSVTQRLFTESTVVKHSLLHSTPEGLQRSGQERVVNLVEQLINEQATFLLKANPTGKQHQAMTVIIMRLLTELRKWADEKSPGEPIQLQRPSTAEDSPPPIANPFADSRLSRSEKRKVRHSRIARRTSSDAEMGQQDIANDQDQIEQDIESALLSIDDWLKDPTKNDYVSVGDQIRQSGRASRGQLIDEQY